MAIKPLKTIKFPGLPDTYTVPQVDSVPTQSSSNAVSSGGVYSALQAVEAEIPDIDDTLAQTGQAADAKVVGDKITGLKADLNEIVTKSNNIVTLENLSEGIVISTSGVETENAAYNTSDYIPITPGETYYFIGISYIAVYKSDKTFRTRIASLKTGKSQKFNSTDYFIRVCSNDAINNWQINVGNEPQEYMPPDAIYLNDNVSITAQIDSTLTESNMAADAKTTGDSIQALTTSIDNIITQTNNIASLNNISEGIVIAANGAENENNSYNTSDYIKVDPSTTYYIKGTPYIVAYNSDKGFRGRFGVISNGSTYTTDASTHYLRITSNCDKDTWQINVGSEAQDYMPPDVILLNKDINIDKQLEVVDERISTLEDVTLSEKSFIIPFKPSKPYWYTGETIISHPNVGELLNLYGLYDALVAEYPLYMAKEVIGRDASNTYDILCYKLTNGINRANQKPIFLWVSNVHGNEANSTISTYYMTKELLAGLAGGDEMCSNILSEIQVWIIPTLNPWGLENYARVNSNNVNLNRNFPADWGYRDPELPYDDGVHSAVGINGNKYYYYGGEYPASESETQALISLVEANKDNIFFAVNKHDAGPFTSEGSAVIFTDVFTNDLKVISGLQRVFATQIVIRQPWVREKERWTSVTRVNLTTTSARTQPAKPWVSCGTMDKWFAIKGIHGCLLEIIAYAGSKTVTYDDGTEGALFNDADHRSDINAINVSVGVNLISTMMCKNNLISNNAVEYTYTEYNTPEDKERADEHRL